MAMKFRAHETFFIRKGWLSKGIRNVLAHNDVFVTKDKQRNPMDELGIGSNMVKSLRYWLQAVGLTREPNYGKRVQTLTEVGTVIHKYDPYFEEMGTLWILQYNLATNKNNATAWYFFFNEFNMTEFTRDDFVQALQNYILMEEETAAIRSLSDDFTCIINTYIPRSKHSKIKISPENNIDCPLGELGLLDVLSKRGKNAIYKKNTPAPLSINPWIVLAVMLDQANGEDEISLNTLLSNPCNIGKVFNLDSITMLEILHQAERTGMIKIVRTAGLDYVKLEQGLSFINCLEKYYEEIIK